MQLQPSAPLLMFRSTLQLFGSAGSLVPLPRSLTATAAAFGLLLFRRPFGPAIVRLALARSYGHAAVSAFARHLMFRSTPPISFFFNFLFHFLFLFISSSPSLADSTAKPSQLLLAALSLVSVSSPFDLLKCAPG